MLRKHRTSGIQALQDIFRNLVDIHRCVVPGLDDEVCGVDLHYVENSACGTRDLNLTRMILPRLPAGSFKIRF